MSLLIQTTRRKPGPRIPWVSLSIILVCFLLTLIGSRGDTAEQLRWLQQFSLQSDLVSASLAELLLHAFTALFLHIQWAHLLGNMAFLLVFGRPVEKKLGHSLFLALFLTSGVLVNLIQFYQQAVINADHILPVIGASGSVSAVIGCYLGLFPRGRIGVYLPLGIFPQFTKLPALLVIIAWFVLQFIYTQQGTLSSLMAWKIHISGFGIGLIAAMIIRKTKL
ncbi:MAG: rhomboid family intramembrane serine protease [Xanthomonadales bacterium]|nr:rhomboid family intramembrane serine protease [Xanthomonadales bacterium]